MLFLSCVTCKIKNRGEVVPLLGHDLYFLPNLGIHDIARWNGFRFRPRGFELGWYNHRLSNPRLDSIQIWFLFCFSNRFFLQIEGMYQAPSTNFLMGSKGSSRLLFDPCLHATICRVSCTILLFWILFYVYLVLFTQQKSL